MKLLLGVLLFGTCLAAPVEKHEAKQTDSLTLIKNLSPERQMAFYKTFANVLTEDDNVRAAGKMKKEDPDLYEILKQSFKDRIKNIKGSDELKEFLKSYYESTADMASGSKEEMEKHHKAVRAKYVNLEQKTQDELGQTFPAVKSYIDGPIGEIRQAFNKLSAEQKLMYKSYFNDATKQLPEDKTVRMVARMHKDDPEIYKIYKMIDQLKVNNYDGSKEVHDFLQFYYEQMEKMPDASQASFDAFVLNIKEEWNKLDDEFKEEFTEEFPGSAELLGEPIDANKELEKLPDDQQKAYKTFRDSPFCSGKDLYKLYVNFHKNSPEVYEKVLKVDFRQIVRNSGKGKEAKQYLKYFFDRLGQVKDTSTAEFQQFSKDVNERFAALSQQAQKQFKKYALFDGIIEGTPSTALGVKK